MTEFIDAIRQAENILVVCHVRPDGDCLGAGLAISVLCGKLNKKSDFVCDSPLPGHYEFIDRNNIFNRISCDCYDLAIAVDCADEFRMGKFGDVFFDVKNTVNIDHHVTNTMFAGMNIVDGTASSTCEIIFRLLTPGNYIDAETAEYLYMGISTDTGHFKHNNTSPATLMTASELLKYNFDVIGLIDRLYRSNTAEKIKLIGVSLNKMRYYAGGKLCIIALSKKDLSDCGCSLSDTEGIIDYPMTVAGVLVAVCMSQQSGTSFKVSFRSKGPDVAKIACKFGGGGHVLASGCVVNGEYNDCIEKVIRAVVEEIE